MALGPVDEVSEGGSQGVAEGADGGRGGSGEDDVDDFGGDDDYFADGFAVEPTGCGGVGQGSGLNGVFVGAGGYLDGVTHFAVERYGVLHG